MVALLDQFGNPIKKQQLLREQATSTLTGVRSIHSNQVTAGITPGRMARILRAAEQGDMTSYLEMAEELEEKDTHYLAVLGTRKRSVAQMEISVEAASSSADDKDAAKLIEDWLMRDRLEDEIFDILDGIGKGFSVTEIIWEDGSNIWMPKELKWRDPRWFQFDRSNGTTLRLRDGASMDGVDLEPYKYIIHTPKAKSGLPVRGGVARPCAWMWLFKNYSIKDWVIFTEAYGTPVRLGKYPAGSSEEDRDTLLRAVANIGSDAAAIIPDSMIVEFVESQGKTGTVDAFERLCKFCDEQMSKAVLGQTTTTDALGGGGLAGNQAHNDVRGDIARADAKQLAATLNEQLIPAIISLNMGPRKIYPRIRIGRPEPVDLAKIASVADQAVRMGIDVSRQGMREKLGLPKPENDDDKITLPETAAPAAPGFSGFANRITAPRRGPHHECPECVSAAAAKDRAPDMIEKLAVDMAEDWEEIMDPIVAEIDLAFQDAESFEDLEARLLGVTSKLNMDPMTEKVMKAVFSARLAGNLNIDPSGK